MPKTKQKRNKKMRKRRSRKKKGKGEKKGMFSSISFKKTFNKAKSAVNKKVSAAKKRVGMGSKSDYSDDEWKQKIINRQKEGAIKRSIAEKNFLKSNGKNSNLNKHIPFHLGNKESAGVRWGEWEADGYFSYMTKDSKEYKELDKNNKNPQLGSYCFKPDDNSNSKIPEWIKKLPNKCCGTDEKTSKDKGNAKYNVAKVPSFITKKCEKGIDFTNDLCLGGEVYIPHLKKSLCCSSEQTPDFINGICATNYKDNMARIKSAKKSKVGKMIVKTGARAASGAAIASATACFFTVPCALVVIVLMVAAGAKLHSMKKKLQNQALLSKTQNEGDKLLEELNKVIINRGNRFSENDVIQAKQLRIKINETSKKLAMQPSGIGEKFFAKIKHKDVKGDGAINGTILSCRTEEGEKVDCSSNKATHREVRYYPHKYGMISMPGSTEKNKKNIQKINALTKDKIKNYKEGKTDYYHTETGKQNEKGVLEGTRLIKKDELKANSNGAVYNILKTMTLNKDAVRKFQNTMKEIEQLMNSGPIAEEFKKSAKAVEKWLKLKNMVTGPGKSNKIALLGKKNAWEKVCPELKNMDKDKCEKITNKIMNNEADAKKNDAYNEWATKYEKNKKKEKTNPMGMAFGIGKKSAISALKAKAKAGLTGDDLEAAKLENNVKEALKHLNNYPKDKREYIIQACKKYENYTKIKEGGRRTRRRRKRKTRRRRKKRNRKSRIKKKGGRKSHRK